MPDVLNSERVKAGTRLREIGWVLPKPPTPLGKYVEVNQVGSLLFLSGTLPTRDGKLLFTGRLGEKLSVEQGREAAHIAALNALALVQAHHGCPREDLSAPRHPPPKRIRMTPISVACSLSEKAARNRPHSI
jgi:hypothetical protein